MSGAEGRTLDDVVAAYRETEAALREATREAHAAAKDLRAATREARTMIDDMADACAKAAYTASNTEMQRWAEHIQHEMNRHAANLNRAVTAARDHVGRAIIPKIAEIRLDDSEHPVALVVQFTGSLFDEGGPLGPERTPEQEIPAAFRGGGRKRDTR